jgi:DNA-binding transcriptional LysR family regulator
LSLVQGAALLSHEVTRMTKLDAGEVRFGSDAVAAVNLVPQAMARFISTYPKVRTALQVDNWEKLGRSLNREEIEFFIADVRHFEADPNFQTQALAPRRSVFFCRAGHPLLAKDSLSTNDLFGYPLATPLIAPGIRKLLANLSGRIDFAPAIELEQFAALATIVRQSDAIGLGAEEAFVEAFASGQLQVLHWRNLPHALDSLSNRCGVISRAGVRLSPAAKALIETLLAVENPADWPAQTSRNH